MEKAKVKLSIDDQIADMKNKGITFSLCSEADARKFLQFNTYYFKLKAYEKLYSNDNKDHKYKNLDFEHIKELSKIDMYLRKIILDMCLDIEHVLKTRLIYDCTSRTSLDGFTIVSDFLNAKDHQTTLSIINKRKSNSACSALASHYYDPDNGLKPMPLWVIVELISFGDFVDLYTFCYSTFNSLPPDKKTIKSFPNYSSYLGSIKYLRNASAHNNCLIYSLKKQPNFSKTYNVMNALSHAPKIPKQTLDHKMAVPFLHDFVTLLLLYNDLLDTPYNKKMRERKMEELHHFFFDKDGRLLSRAAYFSNNPTLTEAYNFICSVLQFIDNEKHKPKRKKLLIAT